ncbi:MAG: phosphatase PAP2 family protein, partial [Cryobacterium sp.]|nr:phosphatase PAP2 family protein [Oligoflexia bacterium]
ITTGIKAFHFEQRPRHNGDRLSFPSGHSSNAFAFAGVIQRNHGWWFGGPAFAGATFVGISRINDSAHYLHDVIFGATLGLSYAFGLDPSWSNRDHSKSIALAPLFTEGRYGAGLTIDF